MKTLPETVQTEIQTIEASISELRTFKVTNSKTSIEAGFALKAAKGARRDLEDLRKKLTKPLDEEKKFIMEEFHGRLATCDVVISHLETELKAWAVKERQRQEEERRKAEEKAAAEERAERERLVASAKEAESNWFFEEAKTIVQQAEMLRVPSVVVPEKRPLIRGLQERKIYKFEITDPLLIPREYLIPDEKKLGELARSSKGGAEVMGVRFYTETIIAG